MEALRVISDEHQSLAAILHALRFMLKETVEGRLAPDVKLFQAMAHYLEAYAEQRHHPKEEVLFRALTARTDEGAAAVATLTAEHAAGPDRIAALKAALAGFVAAPAEGAAGFAAAFDQYADFYRRHMMLEEDVVLPLIRRHVSSDDWPALDRAFSGEEADLVAAAGEGEDFSELFSRLVASAPAPIGYGAHPFSDVSAPKGTRRSERS